MSTSNEAMVTDLRRSTGNNISQPEVDVACVASICGVAIEELHGENLVKIHEVIDMSRSSGSVSEVVGKLNTMLRHPTLSKLDQVWSFLKLSKLEDDMRKQLGYVEYEKAKFQ